MRLFKKVLTILSIIVIFGQCVLASTCDSTSLALMEQTWREFRAIHPFGFQTVGLKHCGDTCIFVISEPNNWVKESDLRQLFGRNGGRLILRFQPFGVDGQLRDAVGCAKLDSLSFLRLEKELFTLLYRTDYKPFYTDLDHPVEHIYFSKESVNYSYIWEHFNSCRFFAQIKNGSTREVKISDLFNYNMSNSNDIYYSNKSGIIVWLIDDKTDILNDSSFLVNARRFALDSDLILGTYRTKHRSAIIGRERKLSVNVLPPLRSETILLLASNREELSLIFNKDSCKVVNDTLCATPIMMSHYLNDTELGNLMVMTDILLKSWSENSKVIDYFVDYPRPKNYPFPFGVAHELGNSTKLLWNLETLEVGWPGFQPVIRTGCPPPTYWSTNEGVMLKQNSMSNIAYNFFARLNCPDLVRITMYAVLYKFFQGLEIKHEYTSGNSWVQTPSYTISNTPWAYGGHSCQLGLKPLIKVSKLSKTKLSKIHRLPTPIIYNGPLLQRLRQTPQLLNVLAGNKPFANAVANNGTLANLIATNKSFANRLAKDRRLVEVITNNPNYSGLIAEHPEIKDIDSFLLQCTESIVVAPVQPDNVTLGFNRKDHVQSTSGSRLLTDYEVKEKKQAYQQKEYIRMEMIMQLQKYGIPLKAIRKEKDNTVYIIIYKYDKESYKYAA